MKALVGFDLDGTLVASDSADDPHLAKLLTALPALIRVAIISGGAVSQFEKQVLAHRPEHEHFGNPSLLPAFSVLRVASQLTSALPRLDKGTAPMSGPTEISFIAGSIIGNARRLRATALTTKPRGT